MGLLDYADTARKKLAGLLGEMPLVQMAQGRAEMPTMAGVLGALKSMPVFSPDAGQSAYEAALNIGPIGLGKIVYHGSPHKFDKFDASKIGTGEGAQAYGHGVYLADSQGVANGYATKLGAGNVEIGGVPLRSVREFKGAPDAAGNVQVITPTREVRDLAARFIEESGGDIEKAAAQARRLPNRISADVEFIVRQPDVKVIPPSLYKADLPDEWIPKMLDWDKPLKDQGEVLSALQKSGYLDEARKSGGFYEGDIASGLMEGRHLLPAKPSAGGREVAEKLRRAGIPGIRYLDGGSRGKGQGSYNYVVFPGLEDQVKILERNGVPLSGLLGGQ